MCLDDQLHRIRHSCAHVLAQAVREHFSGEGPVQLAGGPAIDDGFYYDFALPRPLRPDDLASLEARMKAILREAHPFRSRIVDEPAARQMFAAQPFKLELIDDIAAAGEPLSLYEHASFVDLCEGPHVPNTAAIDPDAVKLLSIAGAYWRGDEKRPMLQRIYGAAFSSKDELAQFLWRRAEAERRDHRKLGKELDLFFFHPTAPGMPYWLPKGFIVLNELISYWRDVHQREGYQEIASPLINAKRLWEISGHWDHYRDEMFLMPISEHEVYGVKPMNCPNAMIVFNHRQRSYRDLPLRLSDCDILHRHERSGTLHGLLRAQKFQQDDAHVFVAEDMIEAEIGRILALVRRFYGIFALPFRLRLSTRPKDAMGDAASWDRAEDVLRRILDREVGAGNWLVGEGDGAFYGPKLDILIQDALGRDWQMGTIQLDLQLPRRFGCAYVDKDGAKKTPVVIHRVIYGSLERFLGVLLEHTGGALPVWLSPVQARILPVAERHNAAARELLLSLREAGLRTACDDSDASVGAKIRAAQQERVPYMIVFGDKEVGGAPLSVRMRSGEVAPLAVSEFVAHARGAIASKA